MRYIIYGAGAIGGTIGARLFQKGQDVILIARGQHLQAIQANGLILEDPHESVTLSIKAVGHPAKIGFREDDVVFLSMKSQHTLSALEDLREAAGVNVPVICCQNGVANERMASRRFDRVYAMVVILPASHLEPGIVQHESQTIGGVLDAGVFPEGTDQLIEQVCIDLRDANISAYPDAKVMRQKYAKMLNNLGNSLQAVSDAGADARDIARQMVHEALECYRVANIDCASREEVQARRADLLQMGQISGRNRGGGSSWQSIMRGTGSIEADYLNGEIVQLGKLYGVATPANKTLQQLGNQVAREKAKVGTIPLDVIRTMISKAAADDARRLKDEST
jgi:2-dehydropantoate 2-reductase|tara:strand:- start:586 stop:1596 length:1011 start_codon:yes stop_codon:yes gene_type:complete